MLRCALPRLAVVAGMAVAGGLTSPAAALAGPTIGGCPVFPAAATGANRGTNADFNRDISVAPLHPRSAVYVASIGAGNLHPDFGSNPAYGIPWRVVPASQPRRAVRFTAYGSESDRGPYPIPANARVEAGSDHHVLVVQQGSCRLFELFGAARAPGGSWRAQSGAVFGLRSGARRREGWTSADAAGLPILPGLARLNEVRSGSIDHALRFTVARSQRAYLHPATHLASSSTDPQLPPMGLRLRLRAGYDLSGFRGASRVILVALKRYGMIVADNGSSWFISGETNRGWNDADLDQLKRVPGSAFEAVDTGQALRPR